MVVMDDPQKVSVVAENVGVVGVGGDSSLVHFLGPVIVAKHVREEESVKIE